MNPLIAHFRLMARYNRLANERLYDCCARLSDAERKKNRQAFFESIHATLNHIMVGDRNWMNRFEGGVAPSTPLDTIFYDDFEELRAARVREDERIERFAAGLSDQFLDRELVYAANDGSHIAIRPRCCWRISSTTRRTIAARSTTCFRRPASPRRCSTYLG
jgi:uncharacterized damage-inducible protein DinB